MENQDLQRQFQESIQKILWEEWDPIGINDGENSCDDEYDSYVPTLMRFALNESNTEELASHLSLIVERFMSLKSNSEHNLRIARLIIQKKEELFAS